MPRFVIMNASAKMPASVKAQYRHVAIVEVEDGFEGTPKFIGVRAKGVRRIVWDSGPCNVGKTEKCAYQRALVEATERVLKLESSHAKT